MIPLILMLVFDSLLTVFVIGLAVSNMQVLTLSIFGASAFSLPLWLVLAIGYLGGAVMMSTVWLFRTRKVQADTTKLEWAKEDAKLMAEVKSDHVKQLEAKVATLEAALSKALKKK